MQTERKPYESWEDDILISLMHVRHSIKLSWQALPHRTQLSIEARRKYLRNPSRKGFYNRQQYLKQKAGI